MRCIVFLLLAVLTCGCNLKQREESLDEREKALSEKEKQLVLYENSLYLWEKKLASREQLLNDTKTDTVQVKDSLQLTDSTYIIDSTIVGEWNVVMTCTQTSCAGFAVGDTKAEKWQFAYSGKELVVKAMVNNDVVRVYNGYNIGNNIELVQSETGSVSPAVTNMTVRLRKVNDDMLEGERVIIRENNCKVVFALRFGKIKE